MYEIIVTNDFINLIREIPIKEMTVLTKSFVSIRKVDDVENNTFISDLIEQIKNQELE